MRRFLLVAVMCGAASVAQAADMPDLPFLRGSFTDGLSSARVNWDGFYVGGQASYGVADIEVVAHCQTATCLRLFSEPPGVDIRNGHCWLSPTANAGYGGFIGYNFAVGGRRARRRGELHTRQFVRFRDVAVIPGVPVSRRTTHRHAYSTSIVGLDEAHRLSARCGHAPDTLSAIFLPYAFRRHSRWGSRTSIAGRCRTYPDPLTTVPLSNYGGTGHARQRQLQFYGYCRRCRHRRDAVGGPVHARRVGISPVRRRISTPASTPSAPASATSSDRRRGADPAPLTDLPPPVAVSP